MTRCVYIAFEGPKGSGKTTAFEAVVRALTFPVRLLCPTRPTDRDTWIERLARAGWTERCDRLRERLYAARSNHAARRARLDEPGVVLGDRSLFTSIVTRWVPETPETRRRVVERVRRLEHHIRLPDHVVYFDTPLEVLLDRLARRQRSYGRRDESPARLAAALAAYGDLRRHAGDLGLSGVRWHVLDASVEQQEIAARALAVVSALVSEAS